MVVLLMLFVCDFLRNHPCLEVRRVAVHPLKIQALFLQHLCLRSVKKER